MQWRNSATGTRDSVSSIAAAVLAAMATVIGCLALCVVTPNVVLVDRARNEYLEPFLEREWTACKTRSFSGKVLSSAFAVPEALVSRLHAHTDKNLRKLEACILEGGGGEEDAAGGDTGSGSDSDSLEGGSNSHEELDTDENGDIDWIATMRRLGINQRRRASETSTDAKPPAGCMSACAKFCSNASRIPPPGDVRPAVRSYLPIGMLFLWFVLPLLTLIAFFGVVYATSVSTVTQSGTLLDISVATELMAIEVAQMDQMVRLLFLGRCVHPGFDSDCLMQVLRVVRSTGAPAAVAVVVALCNTLADSLSYHFGLLHTGGPSQELGLASGALLSGTGLEGNNAAAVTGAIYGNACPFIGAHGHWLNGLLSPFDSADCAVAASGVVTRGLSRAVGYVVDNSRGFCNSRAKATVLDTVGGFGTIPSPTGTALYSIPATLQGAAMTTLLHVADHYVAPAGHGLVSRVQVGCVSSPCYTASLAGIHLRKQGHIRRCLPAAIPCHLRGRVPRCFRGLRCGRVYSCCTCR